jgi:EAL domain-containing protein (putative c-di-GMP-specific phosphodiesterase class I)
VGIADAPTDGGDPATLFKNAEAALKEAKTSGARYRFYSSELNERVAEDLALEQQLLSALQRQEFVVHYQPKIDAKSNELVGLEALLRWNSPDRGLVPPARFIPALEASELILDVGRWVIEKALSDHQAWQQRGLKPPRIAVNVSALQLRYADFPDMVLKAIDERSVESSALELEITESVIMADIQSSIERLEKISERGVTIAIDDFGTGYSSLRYLAKLPVHALKIDRSFVVAMTTDADTMTLVSTIIGLAHAFDMLVVAEGVDSEEQAKLLRLLKCDMMQGYLFGRPQPAEEIEALLAARE